LNSLIYLETNWIVGAVMGQDYRAGELLSSSESEVHLAVPAVCVMETISAFDRKRIERNQLKDELDRQLSQLQRSTNVQAAQRLATELTRADLTNAELLSELFQRLDETLLRIANRAQLIPVSAEIIQHQVQLSRETELDRADALILASILAHSKSESIARKAFLTGNFKDFEKEPVRLLLAEAGIKQFGRALGWIERGSIDPQTEDTGLTL
jgi:predicted nucleic acid-binding protein